MNEPELIHQQRELLRLFRSSVSRRAQVEAEAQRQWQKVQELREQARAILARVGEQALLETLQPAPPTVPADADPAQAFSQSVRLVEEAFRQLTATLEKPPPWTERAILEGHGRVLGIIGSNAIFSVRFSPDGRLLASGGADGKVKLWDVASGREVRTIKGHWDWVKSVAFSQDGQTLASGTRNQVIRLWNVPSGRKVCTLQKAHAWAMDWDVLSVAFSPDGQTLASGSRDRTVKLWDVSAALNTGVASGREVRTLQGHQWGVLSVAFSPDGQTLASGSWDKTVKLWDVASGREVRTLQGHRGFVWSVAFSPDGKTLASGSRDRTVKLWDVASGREVRTLQGHRNWVRSVAFSPDGQTLASGSLDKTVRLWDISTALNAGVASGTAMQTLSTERVGKAFSVAFAPDRRLLAVGGEGKILLLHGMWAELPSLVSRFLEGVAAAQVWYERWQEHAALAYRRTVQSQALTRYHEWLLRFDQLPHPSALAWEPARWQNWRPSEERGAFAVRWGTLQVSLPDMESVRFPALLPFPGRSSLLLKATGAARAGAAQAIQSLLLRLLASLPPGKLRFTFIDPVGLGQNVAPFMHLADYDEQLVTGRAWSEPQHIEQRLADLTQHLENVIQQYLRNQFATIEDYNAQAGEIAEPYRVLVVFDFPTNLSETAARRLVSIAQNGPRCGVHTIVLADTTKPLPHGFNLADLEQNATVIAWDGRRFVWQDEDFQDCLLEPEAPPPAELFTRIITAVGEAAKQAERVEVPFERIAPAPEQWWSADSRAGIYVPLGPSGARRVQHLDLGRGTAQHVLVAGKTGSGKSTLLHTLITNLALAYSPEQVELYLIDFKKGVEFKTYAAHQLPHARVVAIESEREFGLSVLQGLDAELKRRGDLFRAAGVDHIADYRQKTGRGLSRVLLLVDEFQEFFTEDDAIASQASQILDRLVRQGRAFGIHLLLGSQTLAGAYTLARSTIDQMAVRIALQCSEADSRLILADDNPAARLLSRPGEAIYNDANGLVEGNHRFQVAWLPDDRRDQYLARVQALAQERNYRPAQPQLVFEGNAPAQVEKNRPLSDLLAAPAWLAPVRRVFAWLGDPIAIRDPIAAAFRRQSGSNLLIVGQNDEAALGMMAVALISLAAQHAPQNAAFYVLDFGAVDAPYAELFSRLADALPHTVQVGRRRQLPEMIAELAAQVQGRLDAEPAGAPARYLFVYGLQRARDLRQEESLGFSGYGSLGEEPAAPNSAQQFTTILREGPDVGVHTLVWCDTATNLNRSLERRALREFAMRAVFQISAEDSASLIDSPLASKLGAHRALFYDEEEGRLEKFRPYGLPGEEWLRQVKGWLSARSG